MRLEVFDISGKMVFEKTAEAGVDYLSLVLRATDLPGRGVFVYRVQANGEVFSGRVVRE